MTTERFSTNTFARLGTQKEYQYVQDSVVSAFKNDYGKSKAVEFSSLLLQSGYGTSSISSAVFYSVKSILSAKMTEAHAETFALLIVEASSVLEKSPILIAEKILSDVDAEVMDMLVAVNFFQPQYSQRGALATNDNSTSFRSRDIIE